jgi:SAM-dependent methyltransferase
MTNFDPVARIYRYAEYLTLGPLLQRTRTHFLPQLKQVRRALVLGDGDGRFLARLLTQNPTLHATAVDSSAKMLALLRTRCNAETVHADALTYLPSPGTDLIVTHFFLDCFTQPEVNALALRLAQQTQPGTFWLLSDFRIPNNPLKPLARIYIRTLYFAFHLLTNLRVTHLPDPAAALTAAGFHRIAHHETLGGILYTELWMLDPAGYNRSRITHPTTMTEDRPAYHNPEDPQPDPEPAAPSLPEPDPGVYHHDPAPRSTESPK